jgi:cytochrome c oxidase assembly factor CtaG
MIEALPVLALLIAAGTAYGVGVRRIWRRLSRRALPFVRPVCFGLGLLVVAVALIGPIDERADERFSMHMVQHVLLVLVAAPLFAFATPITVLVLALPAGARRRTVTPVLRGRTAHVLLSPMFGWVVFVVVLCGSHVPAIYDLAVAHQAVHDLEHLAYLVTSVLFWMPVVGLDLGPPRLDYPARVAYLFLAMAVTAVLGVVLSTSHSALYPYYVNAARAAGYSALSDQHAGGVIMWTAGMFTVVPVMVAVVLAWMAEDERRTVLMERRREQAAATDARPAEAFSRDL